jgi:hypothetical protein
MINGLSIPLPKYRERKADCFGSTGHICETGYEKQNVIRTSASKFNSIPHSAHNEGISGQQFLSILSK